MSISDCSDCTDYFKPRVENSQCVKTVVWAENNQNNPNNQPGRIFFSITPDRSPRNG